MISIVHQLFMEKHDRTFIVLRFCTINLLVNKNLIQFKLVLGIGIRIVFFVFGFAASSLQNF